MRPTLLISRADRIGDLILSVPAIYLLRQSESFAKIRLHVSSYARDIAEWLHLQGWVDEVYTTEELLEFEIHQESPNMRMALALFHQKEIKQIYQKQCIAFSIGPRSRLEALWIYDQTLRQRRSQVQKSEMEYNLELAKFFLRSRGFKIPRISGAPQLRCPEAWKVLYAGPRPAVWVFVSNGNSALNASMERYLDWIEQRLKAFPEKMIGVVFAGFDEDIRYESFQKSSLSQDSRLHVVRRFESLKHMVSALESAEHVLASSTGSLHVAHAMGIECSAFFPSLPIVQSLLRWRPHGFSPSATVFPIIFR